MKALTTITLAAVLAATLDLTANFILWGLWKHVSPLAICQTIATGLFGKAAYDGGMATAAAGVIAHLLITFVMAAVLYGVVRAQPVLQRLWPVTAVAYGVILYVAMNFVVVPLSAAHRPMPWPVTWDFKFAFNLFCHVVLVSGTCLLVFRARDPKASEA